MQKNLGSLGILAIAVASALATSAPETSFSDNETLTVDLEAGQSKLVQIQFYGVDITPADQDWDVSGTVGLSWDGPVSVVEAALFEEDSTAIDTAVMLDETSTSPYAYFGSYVEEQCIPGDEVCDVNVELHVTNTGEVDTSVALNITGQVWILADSAGTSSSDLKVTATESSD